MTRALFALMGVSPLLVLFLIESIPDTPAYHFTHPIFRPPHCPPDVILLTLGNGSIISNADCAKTASPGNVPHVSHVEDRAPRRKIATGGPSPVAPWLYSTLEP